jgi:hypothetical protein
MADDEDFFEVKFITNSIIVEIEKLSANEKANYTILKDLFSRRENISNKLLKIRMAMQSFLAEEIDSYTFKAKCGMLSRIKDQFETVQHLIYEHSMAIEEDEEENEVLFMEKFERLDIESKLLLEANHTVTEVKQNKFVPSVKLPKLQVPEFHGDYADWKTFRDTYQAVIHDNEMIADINKFHFLLSALKGKTINEVQEIPVTGDNYKLA